MVNHYKTLGVKDFAPTEEIKKAYRKLSKKFHPDVNDGDTFFEERFKEIQNAYECLSDSFQRTVHDERLLKFYEGANHSSYTYKEEKAASPEPKNKQDTTEQSPPTDNSEKPDVSIEDRRSAWRKLAVSIAVVILPVVIGSIVIALNDDNNESYSQSYTEPAYQSTPSYQAVEAEETIVVEETPQDSYYSYTEEPPTATTYDATYTEEAPLYNYISEFTIGSTKDEVLQVQGTPSSVHDYDFIGEEVWHYGLNSITFKKGKVKNYSNLDGNLKIGM